jgi:hypothetical protein
MQFDITGLQLSLLIGEAGGGGPGGSDIFEGGRCAMSALGSKPGRRMRNFNVRNIANRSDGGRRALTLL